MCSSTRRWGGERDRCVGEGRGRWGHIDSTGVGSGGQVRTAGLWRTTQPLPHPWPAVPITFCSLPFHVGLRQARRLWVCQDRGGGHAHVHLLRHARLRGARERHGPRLQPERGLVDAGCAHVGHGGRRRKHVGHKGHLGGGGGRRYPFDRLQVLLDGVDIFYRLPVLMPPLPPPPSDVPLIPPPPSGTCC